MLYYVTGKAKTTYCCECPNCDGEHHYTHPVEHWLVKAEDPEEATEKAGRWLEYRTGEELEGWVSPPDVELVPAAEEMRQAGASPLPGLERMVLAVSQKAIC